MYSAPVPSDRCCEEPGHSACLDESEASYLDPTLASCCQKDLREQERIAQAKKALLSVDRVDKRSRATREVLGLAPPAMIEGSGSGIDDAGSDDDGLLHFCKAAQRHECYGLEALMEL